MVRHPRVGDRVRIRYRRGVRKVMPHHDKLGTVEIVAAGGGGPRNHGVRLDGSGVLTVVPAGNLMRDHG